MIVICWGKHHTSNTASKQVQQFLRIIHILSYLHVQTHHNKSYSLDRQWCRSEWCRWNLSKTCWIGNSQWLSNITFVAVVSASSVWTEARTKQLFGAGVEHVLMRDSLSNEIRKIFNDQLCHKLSNIILVCFNPKLLKTRRKGGKMVGTCKTHSQPLPVPPLIATSWPFFPLQSYNHSLIDHTFQL